MRTSRGRLGHLFSAALSVLVVAEIGGQQAPNFRSGVDLVTVDFLAFDAAGQPLTNLTAADVTLKVNGRARPIRSLQWVQVAEPATDAGAAAEIIPPPFGSNARSDAGRAVIVVLDDESLRTGREAPLRRAVTRFLSSLSPRDRVALVTMPYGGVKVDFTNEHDRIADSLSRIAGQGSRGDEDGSHAACRTRRTLESLVHLLEGLGTPESPTTIMFVTTALSAPRRDAPVTLAPGQCELGVELFQQVGIAASDARAQFYVIQPEDPPIALGTLQTENIAGSGFRGSDNPVEGIEHLSGATGAQRLHLASAGDDTLLRVLTETPGYYLLAFDAERQDRNAQRHHVELIAARDATLRFRPEVFIGRRDAREPAPTPQTMLRASKVFRELPMRAVGYGSRDRDGRIKVIAIVEAVEPGVQLRSASAAIFDRHGRLTAQSTADAAALASTPAITAMVAPPGAYRLRVAATDLAGRVGTADYDLDAELVPAGPLTVSSMMVGLSRKGGFSPRIVFGAEPVAVSYLEIYGEPKGGAVSLTLEVARTPNGPPMLSIPGAVDATRASDRRIGTAAIPLGALPAGDYVLRAVVSMPGHAPGRVIQTVRKIGP